MGEDFQAGVCGSTWWSSPRGAIGFSPCLVAMNDCGSFGWPSNDLVETKARSSTRIHVPNSTFDQGFDQLIQKSSEGYLIDSSLQIMDISSSSTTTDWSQNLFSGSGETNYQSPMVQENMSSSRMDLLNSPNNEIQKEWSLNNISLEGEQDLTISDLKQTNSNTQGFSLESSLLPMSSSSYGYSSTLIENLFGDDDPLSLVNRPINFLSTTGYRRKVHEISPFHLNENTSLWNSSTAAPPSDITIKKLNLYNLKAKSNSDQNSKKISAEPASKRARIETPSPLPSFKVRKEKLGDHITALQQLVSPFGKTDTASVLQEAIEYIKFLHDQVNVLSTPYMKNKSPIQQQQNHDNTKDLEEPKQDLKSRGLCLVPISSTFPVANETTPDFWTPSFGGQQDREHIQTSLNNAIFCPYLV